MLRPYQLQASRQVQNLTAGFRPARRIILVSPTGTGKTETALFTVQGKVLYVAHTRRLVNQTAQRATANGWMSSIVDGDHKDSSGDIVCSTIQSLGDWALSIQWDWIVYDEAHRILPPLKLINKLMSRSKNCKLLGLTATPLRSDGQPLGLAFDETVIVKGYESYLPQKKEVSVNVRTIGDVYNQWLKHTGGKVRTVCFCATIETSQLVAQYFSLKGVCAYHVDGKSQRQLVDEAEQHGLFISNVNMFVEGTDIRDVGCVLDIQATQFIGRHVQKKGRARGFEGVALYINCTGVQFPKLSLKPLRKERGFLQRLFNL